MQDFQEVELEDGTVLEFPSGMSDEEIGAAIDAEYGAPPFGTGYRRASGDLALGIFPGVTGNVPQEGRPSIEVRGEGPFPSAVRTGMTAGRNLIAGLSDLGSYSANSTVRKASQAVSSNLPEVEATRPESIAGEILQYAVPGAGSYRAASGLLVNAPRIARTAGPAIAAIASDFAVTNPDTATTLGTALERGPTQIEATDNPFQRRAKVAAESAVATAGLAAMLSGVPALYRLGRRVVSARADVDAVLREQLRDVYSKGQVSQSGNDAIDEARDALAELISTRQQYNRLAEEVGPTQAILQIDEEMRPFVAGNVQVTPGEYLAARNINVGGLETYYAVSGTEQARAASAARRESTRQSLGETLGRGQGEMGRLRDIAEGRRAESANLVQRLYDDVLNARGRAEQNYEAALGRSDELLRDADELEAAGRIDAAARAEREAASQVRDTLYGAIDPQGRIPLGTGTLDRAYSSLTIDGQLTEELSRDISGFGKLQAVLNRVRRQDRMSYGDVLDIQRVMSGIIRSANKNNSAFTEDLINFRNTVRDEYLAEVERSSPLAAEIAQSARQFMAEDFSPRFRRLAGQVFDSELRRAEGTGSRRIVQSFINKGATGDEDAAILNRILMGTQVDEQTVARIAQAAGVQDLPLGRAELRTRTQGAYEQSVNDVADYYTAMLATNLRRATAASPQSRAQAARSFIEQYSNSIRQFQRGDGSNPVLQSLEDVASRLEGSSTSAETLRSIDRVANRVGRMAGSVRDIAPERAAEVISRLAADMTATQIDDAVYSGVIRDLSRARDQLAERGRDIVPRRFADTDPARGVARIFGAGDPAGEMRAILRDLPSEDVPALKAAVAEHIIDSRIGSGQVTQANLRQVNDWLSRPINQRALRQVYSADEMSALNIMQQQIQNMDISTNMRTRAFSSAESAALFDTLMNVRREFVGATQGMGNQVRVSNQARLFSRLRSLVSDNPDIQSIFDQRLVEIAHDPQAAAQFLEPMSAERAIREIQALIEGGRLAYLSMRAALDEEQNLARTEQAVQRDYTAL
jgi:hypothetical protein